VQLAKGPEVTRRGVQLGGGCDSSRVCFCLDMGEREQDTTFVAADPAQSVAVPIRSRAMRER
jgi:hypothetical protein